MSAPKKSKVKSSRNLKKDLLKIRKKKVKGTTLNSLQIFEAYRQMLRARIIDQKAITLYKQNKSHFHIGVSGHEAVQLAAALVFRSGQDWFYPYYRDMALVCGLGGGTKDLLLNIMNKAEDPHSHGRQMPMHYGDRRMNIVSQSSPTGSQFNQAVGCALGAKRSKAKEVIYVSSGEGACSQGDFHEALNCAAIEKLPLIFLIQRNEFAISVPIEEQIAGASVVKIASGYEGVSAVSVDGTDLLASYRVIKEAYDRALKGKGPSLIEAAVPRLLSHSISDDHLKYRDIKEIEKDKKRCPIHKLQNFIIKNKIAGKKQLQLLEENLKNEIDQLTLEAESQPDPTAETATDFTFYPNDPALNFTEREAQGEKLFMVDALNRALDQELALNDKMYVFGQDVAGGKGGVFSITTGLTKKYGKDRVFNSQLAESSIIGNAIGMAVRGLKPVPEIQFADYVWTAGMQLRDELAMFCYRSAGDWTAPVTIRIPVGGYIHGGPYHSQSIEATLAHFPGLYVAMPSNATDAFGLLKASIRSSNPVIFLEQKSLYRQPAAAGPVDDSDFLIPLGKASVKRSGADLTIITWGAIVHKALWVAQDLAEEDISVEVIDLRTIVPLDMETVIKSVRKTARVLIAHEDLCFMGFGAEVAAQISDSCFEYLDAPVKRIGMKYAAAVPHSPILEQEILLQNSEILKAAKELLEY